MDRMKVGQRYENYFGGSFKCVGETPEGFIVKGERDLLLVSVNSSGILIFERTLK